MRDWLKKEWPALLLLLAPFVALPFVWADAPARMPLHWDGSGAVDHYGSKAAGLLLLPAVNVGVYGLLLFFPTVDPKRRLAWNQKPLPALRSLCALLFTALHFVTLAVALGWQGGAPERLISPVVVLLFLGLGNYLSAVPPNYFLGIRTPWTLEDPVVWRKTHRMAGWLWMGVSGLLLLAWHLVASARFDGLLTAGIAVMAAVPVAYSFYLWKRRPSPG